jgi:Holliday junction resolvasome RuvABC ATP-dependent DNA helicase subunit
MKQQWLKEIEKYNKGIDRINAIKRGEIVFDIVEKIGEQLTFPKFDDVIYSSKQKEFMGLIINDIKRGINRNLLFKGMAGTGKTFSAKMVAVETQKPYIYINGQMTQKRIFDIVTNLKDNSLVLIDEIHNLPEKVAEILYPAIEYGEISDNGKTIKLNNPLFIGTTTEPEQLPKPLQDRFFAIEFDEPDDEMCKKILEKMNVDKEAIDYLILYTTNIRKLKKLISMLDLFGKRDMESLNKVFRMLKINIYNGLSEEQTKYLDYLKKHKKGSLRALGLVMRRSEDYIKYEVEEGLLKKGLVVVTSKGRELSPDLQWDSTEELERAEELIVKEPKFKEDSREKARRYLEENPSIKEKFGKKYFELISFMAEQVESGNDLDLVDWESFGTDKKIKDSYEDNYLGEL